MTMYFLEDWKKKPQDSYEYVNRHASGEMFRNLRTVWTGSVVLWTGS